MIPKSGKRSEDHALGNLGRDDDAKSHPALGRRAGKPDAVASAETSMMPELFRLVSVLREQMNATLSRSDALKPLAWLIVILTTTPVMLAYVTAPEWLLIVAACLLSTAITLYFVAFGYCLVKDRDALRSETYSLHKIAIEHGLIGDSITGVIAPETGDQHLLVQRKTASQQ